MCGVGGWTGTPLSSLLALKQLRGRGEALFFAACPAPVALTSKLLPK